MASLIGATDFVSTCAALTDLGNSLHIFKRFGIQKIWLTKMFLLIRSIYRKLLVSLLPACFCYRHLRYRRVLPSSTNLSNTVFVTSTFSLIGPDVSPRPLVGDARAKLSSFSDGTSKTFWARVTCNEKQSFRGPIISQHYAQNRFMYS